ncbi:MAG TPA: aldose epimerase family protein, partial [Sphingobacteriaceae bacterium]
TFKESGKAGVVLSLVSPDLEEGYPGNLTVEVTYTLSNLNELSIAYKASTDQPTVVNLTNHTYFNLSAGKRDISSHLIYINATEFTPTDDSYIPLGSIEPVENSIFDLREAKQVGEFMHQIITANYCLNNHKEFEFAARLSDPESGKSLEIRTTNPGLQLYCGNYLSGNFKPFSGICLEPQFYPDSPNHTQFPSTLLLPGEVYNEVISYKFC